MKAALRRPTTIICGTILILIVLAATFAGVIAPHDPEAIDLGAILARPGGDYPLGTDSAGRDVLSRLLYGAIPTLVGALIATVTAMGLGLILGLLAGYLGGRVDATITWVMNLMMSLPIIIVMLAFVAVTGPNLQTTMLLLGVLITPFMYRLLRASVKTVRNELYVDAARVSGLSQLRILVRHVLPVIRTVIIVQTPLLFGLSILIQAGLDFLGLGEPGSASWGSMLEEASTNIYRAPWLSIWPGVTISVTVLAVTLLGNAVRDGLEASTATGAKTAPASAGDDEEVVTIGQPDADEALLHIENLTVKHRVADQEVTVVDDVSISVRRSEIVGLVGESGSGKTQTVLAAIGLLAKSGRVAGGSIVFDGVELASATQSELNRLRGPRIGYVSQDPMSNLDPSFTIGSQLTVAMLRHKKINRKEAERQALVLLERVGITDPHRVLRSYPHQISGGMAQRVLIAAAISCDPELLVADEPTTALDVTVQAEILDLLRSLQIERSMAILLVTHDLGVVADLCDRVVVMRNGRVVENVPTEMVFYQPASSYARELLTSVDPNRRSIAPPVPLGAARLLDVEHLGVAFRRPGWGRTDVEVLKDVSVHIDAGETLGLVGESGSGKTTLGRAILGLAPQSPGSLIRWHGDGEEAVTVNQGRTPVGVQAVFQDPYSSLNPAMSIRDILIEPMLAKSGPGRPTLAAAEKRIRELLDRVSLPSDTVSRRARELSGGQRQRVAIARAVALDPKLIVCDEAVSALDATTQAQVLELLAEIQRDSGVSYLFISHDLAVVRQVSHRVAVMSQGKIVEVGDAEEVTSSPSDEYTQRLLLAALVADPRLQAERRATRLANQAEWRRIQAQRLLPSNPYTSNFVTVPEDPARGRVR